MKRTILTKLGRLIRLIYLKLFRINSTPGKLALGFGLGVFTGVMPGIGPLMALASAFIFRVNRASALLGNLVFNAWTNVVMFLFAVKIGTSVMGLNYSDVCDGWKAVIKNFSWPGLLRLSFYKVLAPTIVGYLTIAVCLAILSSLIIYIIARSIKNKKVRNTKN